MKTAVKKLVSAMENKDADTLQAALKESQSVIAKTASRGVIHKKTASRKISRLTRRAQRALQAES
jgi:small subunit ribosomal protein S20